jgi:hypothetical protein
MSGTESLERRLENEALSKIHASLPLAITLHHNKYFSLVFLFLGTFGMSTNEFENFRPQPPLHGIMCCHPWLTLTYYTLLWFLILIL